MQWFKGHTSGDRFIQTCNPGVASSSGPARALLHQAHQYDVRRNSLDIEAWLSWRGSGISEISFARSDASSDAIALSCCPRPLYVIKSPHCALFSARALVRILDLARARERVLELEHRALAVAVASQPIALGEGPEGALERLIV